MDTSNPADVDNLFMAEVLLDEVSTEVPGLINLIRILENRDNALALTGPRLIDEVAELFPIAGLFSPDMQTIPIAHTSFRD